VGARKVKMNFILQNEVYYKILNEIRTPTGRISEPLYQKYFYVLHYINRCKLFDVDDYEIGVAMYYPVLEEILMLKSVKVSQILRWFLTNKILIKTKNYSVGHSSSRYKLHPDVEKMAIDTNAISGNESRLVKKMNSFHNGRNLDCSITKHQSQLINEKVMINEAGMKYLFKKYPDLEDAQEVNFFECRC
jgi:hypothetical protein